MTTPEQIRQRRAACHEATRQAHVEFNRVAVAVAEQMQALQAECQHPKEATIKEYHLSHFKTRCGDCGKLLT